MALEFVVWVGRSHVNSAAEIGASPLCRKTEGPRSRTGPVDGQQPLTVRIIDGGQRVASRTLSLAFPKVP
jgi:hypothetical protein